MGRDNDKGGTPMIDSSRRTVLTNAAAATAATTAPQVFAQGPQAEAPTGLPAGAKVGFYEKSNVRIRYAEIGSGFFGNCIGGPFGMKLIERAPARVVAAVLSP